MRKFIITDMEDVEFLKRNFRGEAERFNDEGDRYFAIAIPVDQVDKLKELGYNVKVWNKKAAPEEQIMSLTIKVNYDWYPPQIVVIRNGRKIELGENEVKMLDWADIEKCDIVIRGKVWDDDTGRRSAMLKTMFVTIAQSRLEARYEDVPYEDGT